MAGEFSELARSGCPLEHPDVDGFVCTSCFNRERDLGAVARATREHMLADPEETSCDDPPDGDGTILGPKCLADIARRVREGKSEK